MLQTKRMLVKIKCIHVMDTVHIVVSCEIYIYIKLMMLETQNLSCREVPSVSPRVEIVDEAKK